MVALRKSFEDEDTLNTTPDTVPAENQGNSELYDAVEWLKKAGVVSAEAQPFTRFFEELAGSNDD